MPILEQKDGTAVIDTLDAMLHHQIVEAMSLEQCARSLLQWLGNAAAHEEVRAQTEDCAQRCDECLATLGHVQKLVGPDEAPHATAIASGAVSDAIELIESTCDDVRDGAVLATALRLAHLQIAAYDALIATAEAARRDDVALLLEHDHSRIWESSDDLVATMRPKALLPHL